MSTVRRMERPLTPLPLASFFVHGDTLVAEASMFTPVSTGVKWVQRMFYDAADVGIAIRSPKTARTMRFVYTGPITENGEHQGWRFQVYEPDAHICPRLKSVVIWND